MTDPRYTKLARLLVEYSTALKPGDRILLDLTGPASQRSFEVFFGQDSARTPLLIRIPFELGTFSLKLVK